MCVCHPDRQLCQLIKLLLAKSWLTELRTNKCRFVVNHGELSPLICYNMRCLGSKRQGERLSGHTGLSLSLPLSPHYFRSCEEVEEERMHPRGCSFRRLLWVLDPFRTICVETHLYTQCGASLFIHFTPHFIINHPSSIISLSTSFKKKNNTEKCLKKI